MTKDVIGCYTLGCVETIENHAWARTRASAAGWYFAISGAAYCPEHKPAWVNEWRRRKAAQGMDRALYENQLKAVDSLDQY